MALGLTMMRRLDEFTRARPDERAGAARGLQVVPWCAAPLRPDRQRARCLSASADSVDERGRAGRVLRRASCGRDRCVGFVSHVARRHCQSCSEHLADPERNPVGARHVAAHIVTLPTHTFVQPADVETTVAVVAASRTSDADRT